MGTQHTHQTQKHDSSGQLPDDSISSFLQQQAPIYGRVPSNRDRPFLRAARGLHVYCPNQSRWTFEDRVEFCELGLARSRKPTLNEVGEKTDETLLCLLAREGQDWGGLKTDRKRGYYISINSRIEAISRCPAWTWT